ncbi:hypothetical protein ABTZ58_10180 [Streptomyces sp. NPDC094143]|uniref:hypothetical protein n=1 Tax=Streptomyces sp. NPDC094143 TaxID=3155310 RepID=UPI00331F4988
MPDRPDEVRQVVVHPAVWPHLETWLVGRGIELALLSPAGEDLATYVMTPINITAGETA